MSVRIYTYDMHLHNSCFLKPDDTTGEEGLRRRFQQPQLDPTIEPSSVVERMLQLHGVRYCGGSFSLMPEVPQEFKGLSVGLRLGLHGLCLCQRATSSSILATVGIQASFLSGLTNQCEPEQFVNTGHRQDLAEGALLKHRQYGKSMCMHTHIPIRVDVCLHMCADTLYLFLQIPRPCY